MRSTSLLLVGLTACSTQPFEPADKAPSVRARLVEDAMTRLMLSANHSAGTVTVMRKVVGGWETGLADLSIQYGEIVAAADAESGEVTIAKLSIALEPIEIPRTVFNREASLSHVHAELATPAVVKTTWTDDNTAHLTATLDLAFAWSLTVEGNTSGLGAPDLPPLTLEIDVSGDGGLVHADIRAGAGGDLWSWAGLVKLRDLALTIAAETP